MCVQARVSANVYKKHSTWMADVVTNCAYRGVLKVSANHLLLLLLIPHFLEEILVVVVYRRPGLLS